MSASKLQLFVPPWLLGRQSYGVGDHPAPARPRLHLLHLRRPCFQVRSHSVVQEVRVSTCKCEGQIHRTRGIRDAITSIKTRPLFLLLCVPQGKVGGWGQVSRQQLWVQTRTSSFPFLLLGPLHSVSPLPRSPELPVQLRHPLLHPPRVPAGRLRGQREELSTPGLHRAENLQPSRLGLCRLTVSLGGRREAVGEWGWGVDDAGSCPSRRCSQVWAPCRGARSSAPRAPGSSPWGWRRWAQCSVSLDSIHRCSCSRRTSVPTRC